MFLLLLAFLSCAPAVPSVGDSAADSAVVVIEEECPTWYIDADGDGHGDPEDSQESCVQPVGYVSSATDCNDSKSWVYLGADEFCNGYDDNCNGKVDEGAKTLWYPDHDGDGFGNDGKVIEDCIPPAVNVVRVGGDCNDRDPAINPAAAEVCNGLDDDCSGKPDDTPECQKW